MNEITRDKISPNHKIGIKILSKEQLLNSFSMYPSLKDKFKIHRDNLKFLDSTIWENYQYNLMYDNIFSIFGARGSGKTSTLFTLRYIIEKEGNDLVFPIIIPEIIPEGCTVFGWILSILKSIVDTLESEIRNLEGINKNDNNLEFFKECRFNRVNKLRKQLDKVLELCFSGGNTEVFTHNYSESISIKVEQAQNNYEMTKSIIDFWTYLVETLKYKNKYSKNLKDNIPLIFIMFDDIDLVPQRTNEMLNTICKFLSHPNVISIIAANEVMLMDVIYQRFREQIGTKMIINYLDFSKYDFKDKTINPNNFYINDSQEFDKIIGYTKHYLNKMLPPATRYYLDSYRSCTQKKDFINYSEKERAVTLSKNLADMVDKFIGNIKPYFQDKNIRKLNNFLIKDEEHFLISYLMPLGDTAREICNGSFNIIEFISEIESTYIRYKKEEIIVEEFYKEIYTSTIRFLDIMILSNTELSKYVPIRGIFIEKLVKYFYDNYYIYFDYYANEVNLIRPKEYTVEFYETIIKIHILMWFAESITWIVLDDKNEVHGRTCLIETINKYTKNDIQLVRKDLEINDIMYYYEYFFENISELYSFDIFDDETLDNFLYQTSKLKVKLSISTYRKDPKWFCSYTKLVYCGFSGITLIDEEMHKRFVINDFDINEDILNYIIFIDMKQMFIKFIYNNNDYIKVSKDFISTFEKNKFGKDEYDIIEKDLFNQVKSKYENCENKEIHSSQLDDSITQNRNFRKFINTYIYDNINLTISNYEEIVINLDELITNIENDLSGIHFVNEVFINNSNDLLEILEEIGYAVYGDTLNNWDSVDSDKKSRVFIYI